MSIEKIISLLDLFGEKDPACKLHIVSHSPAKLNANKLDGT